MIKSLPILSQDVDAVKSMTRSERDELKDKINSCHPHDVSIFMPAGSSRNPDKCKIICPLCGNGTGKDATPVEVTNKNGVWLYNCFRDCGFQGDLLKIIASERNLNLHDFNDLCEALVIGANLIKYSLPYVERNVNNPRIIHRANAEDQLPLIDNDIADATHHLADLPESQRRALSLETLQHFKVGFLPKWIHPKNILENSKVAPTRRIIIPAGNHYNAVALPADRPGIPKRFHKMHAGKMELFNPDALSADLIVVVEGEFDAMSIWQASGSKIAVVAVLGVKNWKVTLAPKLKTCAKKKFLILFDGSDESNAGRDAASRFRFELIEQNISATCKFYDDFLSDDEKKIFANKTIDANEILQQFGNDFLKQLTEKIISDATADFEALEKEFANRADSNILTAEQRAFLFSGDLSDDDFAKKIAFMYKDCIRFIANPVDEWLIFKNNPHNGGVWKNAGEKNSALYPFTVELAEKLIANAESKDEQKFGKKLKETKKKNSSITAIKGIRPTTITLDDLNTHDNLLNVLNGVIDLENRSLLDAAPELLLTQQVNAIYRRDYHNKFVDDFLIGILPDEPTRNALIRFLGYAATGLCSEERALFCNGAGGNGKGTLTKTLLLLFADYATALRTSAVLFAGRGQDAGAATTELNPLENCRLAIVEELPQGGKLDVAKFKNLTGGDKIPIRRLHQEQITIEPHFSPILSGNYLPELSDTRDPGLLRRIMNIPFTQSFIGKERDPKLKAKLATPDALSGLLSLIVDAAKDWYRNGLLESDSMRQATKEYFEENDFIGEFIDEHCDRGKDLSIPRKEFMEKLKDECETECRRLFSNRDRALTDAIRRIDGITYQRNKAGNSFHGIGWKGAPRQGKLNMPQSSAEYAATNDFDGEPIDSNTATPFDPENLPI